jgi:ABC-type Na+ efflux pump permease subunit
MNQINIFTAISAVLILQGIFFYLMGSTIVSDAFTNLDEAGKFAASNLMQVLSALSIIVGLITYTVRDNAEVLWAYAIGFSLLCVVSLKHLLMDHINVPIPALVIQICIVLLSAYLWMQRGKSKA